MLRGLERAAEANVVAECWVNDRATVERMAEAVAGSNNALRGPLLNEINARLSGR